MDKKQITHVLTVFLRRIKKYSNKLAVTPDEESIHQLRVEYKKMRAFLRLLSQPNGHSRKINIPGRLKQAYSIAGDLRDWQLQQHQLHLFFKQKTMNQDAATTLLQKKKHLLETELLNKFEKHPVTGCKKKIIPLLPGELPVSQFKLFIQKNIAVVNSLLSHSRISDTSIHTIRKLLKDIFYNLQRYDHKEKNKLSKLVYKQNHEKTFKQLLTELGNFQDKCRALALLDEFGSTAPTTLVKIKKQWTKEKTEMKRILIQKLKVAVIAAPPNLK